MPDGIASDWPPHHAFALALVVVCVATAGCAGIGLGGGDATPSPATTGSAGPADAPTASPTSASTASERGSSAGSDGHDHNHTHAEGTETGGAASEPPGSSTAGKITVAVDGAQLDLSARDQPDGFDVTAEDEHTWVAANESTTLSAALGTFGVDANASTFATDGEIYHDGANGTTVAYRVDGESVDPTTYQIQDADFVWVTVHTGSAPSTPAGTAIEVGQQHAHGPINVTVDGHALDFSRERFQAADRFFHFEGGNGELWHAHHTAVTLEYALDSLPGVEANASSFTYDGTTYRADGANATISYRVDGEPVDPGAYYLKDGDAVTVVAERSG